MSLCGLCSGWVSQKQFIAEVVHSIQLLSFETGQNISAATLPLPRAEIERPECAPFGKSLDNFFPFHFTFRVMFFT
jgi:hypothetical protein